MELPKQLNCFIVLTSATWQFVLYSPFIHYSDVIMNAKASQITRFKIVYSTVYSGAGQRKCESSASLAFVRGIHRWPVNSPHKGPVTRKMFPFDDIIMLELTAMYSIRSVNAGDLNSWINGLNAECKFDFSCLRLCENQALGNPVVHMFTWFVCF